MLTQYKLEKKNTVKLKIILIKITKANTHIGIYCT